jgi:hypothetical protein
VLAEIVESHSSNVAHLKSAQQPSLHMCVGEDTSCGGAAVGQTADALHESRFGHLWGGGRGRRKSQHN